MNGVNLAIRAEIRGDYTATQGVVADDARVAVAQEIDLLTGTGQDQADLVATVALALGPSGTQTINLQSITDALGATVNFARVKAIFLGVPKVSSGGVQQSGVGISVSLAGGASNPFLGPLAGTTPSLAVNGGGLLLTAADDPTGWAVSSGAANIKLTNNSSTLGVTGTLVIIGADA